METLNVKQGTPEWLVARVDYDCASEAAAALGFDKKTSRTELMRMKATGSEKEFSDWVHRKLFEKGHEIEREARRFAEARIGDLYPQVGVIEINGLRLLASFDGLTSDDGIVWECKSRNAELLAAIDAGDLPNSHWPQVEQQLLISQADYALFTVSDGTEDGSVHFEYRSRPDRRALLLAGWAQWHADFEEYVPAPIEVKAVGRTPETLPALRLELKGEVTASNLKEFKEHALAVFAGINRELTTDQHFADAEKTHKWCGDVESRLEAAKQHALSQTESIDLLFRTIDEISAEARDVRIELEKLVTKRKVEIKEGVILKAKAAYNQHIDSLIAETGGTWIVLTPPNFAEAAKGKRSITSMQDAVDTVLANAKIEADASAKRIRANLACIKEDGAGFEFLFADKLALISKPIDDLRLVVKTRIAEEEKRKQVERDSIAEEERVKAEAKVKADQDAAQKKTDDEARAQAPATVAPMFVEAAPAKPTQTPGVGWPFPVDRSQGQAGRVAKRPAVDNRPPITTGALCALAGDGCSITAAFIQALGINPADRPKDAKSGTYWAAADVPVIFAALARHFEQLATTESALAA